MSSIDVDFDAMSFERTFTWGQEADPWWRKLHFGGSQAACLPLPNPVEQEVEAEAELFGVVVLA